MNNSDIFLVYTFVHRAHALQMRRNGEPYINHLLRVAVLARRAYLSLGLESGQNPSVLFVRAVAVGHDLKEDQPSAFEDFKDCWPDLADGVETLSRRQGETYFAFIKRIASAPIYLRLIKMADLQDNMFDLEEGSMKDKYRFAFQYLFDSDPIFSTKILDFTRPVLV